jgi:hypothetical protein
MATAPHYGDRRVFGPFYRSEADKQQPSDARKQLVSGEVWGCPSVYSGDEPFAKAYMGPLPDGESGIEFYAFSEPDKRWGRPEWRVSRLGPDGERLVYRERDATLGDVVKLKVAITRVTQGI